jgi:hypothetical protein
MEQKMALEESRRLRRERLNTPSTAGRVELALRGNPIRD